MEVSRRAAIEGIAALAALAACGTAEKDPGFAASNAQSSQFTGATVFESAVAALEARHKAHVGVFALDTGSGNTLEHRADQRFMMCSVWKTLVVGLVLRRAQADPGLLAASAVIPADPGPIAEDSPFAKGRLGQTATYSELCGAAIRLSDNIAANILLQQFGGPPAVTDFVRSLGDATTRLDRYEEEMNYGSPEDLLDTTTARALASTYQKLLLGDALAPPQRQQLTDWMEGTTTGLHRIRAGLPAAWRVADKTGTAGRRQGNANDVAIAWPDGGRAPLAISVLTVAPGVAKPDDRLLADVASAARSALALK
ncbi:Beta-lactamase [Segniliparus rotundus DSM 44985]|uniref:Beta-lactamase n=1 Tax=Segniliparus rotundus (strain ATCC BAA-972 / CDC 1076 / CIP 108378 / DSM 44985 / JCM 13578) TaxID=640132 RepID=D6Z9W4_SEGRD|nr:class A beta-lactamase [Segniliparus rotundus]ADG98634.1 Beta-lactamase [Segniliparus rotundus DSM 44985]